MKQFIINIIKNIALFFCAIVIFCIVVLFLPSSPHVRDGMLYGKNLKDSLLINTDGRRIILVGGSNLSFGIDSQMIQDSLTVNPVNTAIHAGIGLEYMLLNTSYYIRENDIILIAPEYDHFLEHYVHGLDPMISTCFEVDNFRHVFNLSPSQIYYIFKKSPNYCFRKLDPYYRYLNKTHTFGIYGKRSFNRYGDAIRHYNLPNEIIKKSDSFDKLDYNPLALNILKEFRKKVDAVGATLLLSYPSLHSSGSKGGHSHIVFLDSTLIANDFNVISDPFDYIMSDSLFFNSRYHLNKQGVEFRTAMLIRDLKKVLEPENFP
jgi:hypothetical protein